MLPGDERRRLRADCGHCAGLCCVAPAFAASADFAIDKPAGRACPNLADDFGCDIHNVLRGRGFKGCAAFDCFGAGQHVVQVTFGGADWRNGPELATSMFSVFTVIRQLNELLWYLAGATELATGSDLREEVEQARAITRRLAAGTSEDLEVFDGAGYRRELGNLLGRVSEAARTGFTGRVDRRAADLIGATLRGVDLRGVNLRGAYLIGADLRGADLGHADLLGADLRAADLRSAKLSQAIFLTQPQLDAAVGDDSTTIPSVLIRPAHWSGSQNVAEEPTRRRGR